MMIVNVSPTMLSHGETLGALRFAKQVNQCELGRPQRTISSMPEDEDGEGGGGGSGGAAGEAASAAVAGVRLLARNKRAQGNKGGARSSSTDPK